MVRIGHPLKISSYVLLQIRNHVELNRYSDFIKQVRRFHFRVFSHSLTYYFVRSKITTSNDINAEDLNDTNNINQVRQYDSA